MANRGLHFLDSCNLMNDIDFGAGALAIRTGISNQSKDTESIRLILGG